MADEKCACGRDFPDTSLCPTCGLSVCRECKADCGTLVRHGRGPAPCSVCDDHFASGDGPLVCGECAADLGCKRCSDSQSAHECPVDDDDDAVVPRMRAPERCACGLDFPDTSLCPCCKLFVCEECAGSGHQCPGLENRSHCVAESGTEEFGGMFK